MILAAGVFIIVLAGMGVTRSGQIKEYDALSANLSVTGVRLNNLQVSQLQAEMNEYEAQLEDTLEQVVEAREKLLQSVISVDVAEKFYDIAYSCNVIVENLSTTVIAEERAVNIDWDTISLSGKVIGEPEDIVKFVLALNNNFSSGYVKAAQLRYTGVPVPVVDVQMIIYTAKED